MKDWENGTLIEKANGVEFAIHSGNVNMAISKRKSTVCFFRLDRSCGQKSYDKSIKMLPLS